MTLCLIQGILLRYTANTLLWPVPQHVIMTGDDLQINFNKFMVTAEPSVAPDSILGRAMIRYRVTVSGILR